MKKYWHEKTIEFPIYAGNLKIILSNDTEKVNDLLNYDCFSYATTFHRGMDGMRTEAIVLNFDNECSITHATIAHESVHAADFLFESIDAKHAFDNPEPYAYLVGWICDQVYDFIYEKNFQSKIKLNKNKWTKTSK